MPHKITSSNLLLLAQADSESRCGSRSREVTGKSTQFNRVGASESAPQIVLSLLASRTAIGSSSATKALSILDIRGPDIFTLNHQQLH